jgi:hypothetical protein
MTLASLRVSPHRFLRNAAALLVVVTAAACAQTPPAADGTPGAGGATTPNAAAGEATSNGTAPAAKESATASKLDALGWLSGCWRGEVNQRVFREQWLPLAGNLLVGAGHVVMQGHTQDYQYLRLEPRGDDVYYVIVPGGPAAPFEFKLASVTRDEPNHATIFAFERTQAGYPQRIVYRRGEEGWLYASVEGVLGGKERDVIYPMRRVDCETGELIKH